MICYNKSHLSQKKMFLFVLISIYIIAKEESLNILLFYPSVNKYDSGKISEN